MTGSSVVLASRLKFAKQFHPRHSGHSLVENNGVRAPASDGVERFLPVFQPTECMAGIEERLAGYLGSNLIVVYETTLSHDTAPNCLR